MKKVLLALCVLITGAAMSQPLDTVYVRNLTLQAQDWAWLTGKYTQRTDSVTIRAFRKIRTQIQSNIPPAWTTNVTIDSLPGKVVVAFYQMVKNSSAGEIVTRYTTITNAIAAKAPLAYWVGVTDGTMSAEFIRNRDLGKNDLIDQ